MEKCISFAEIGGIHNMHPWGMDAPVCNTLKNKKVPLPFVEHAAFAGRI